jgi:hypothetical protein
MRSGDNPTQPILLSRLRGQKYPPPIPSLGNLEHYLAKPFEQQPRSRDLHLTETRISLPVPGPLDPTKRDGMLSYAYSLYDAFVTGESPAGPEGPDSAHAPMLLPLLELLHGLDPSHLHSALLLGCVYHRQGLHQRALDVNRELLEIYPGNVGFSFSVLNVFADVLTRWRPCVTSDLLSRRWDSWSKHSSSGGKHFMSSPRSGTCWYETYITLQFLDVHSIH